MLSESVTLRDLMELTAGKHKSPNEGFFGVSSWCGGGQVALIMWGESRTPQYHVRRALQRRRTEQIKDLMV